MSSTVLAALAARAHWLQRRVVRLALIWAVLLLAPFWAPLLGGYTALLTRVMLLGLAAMSFNILLGFTGVMSFGHAAFFGLGAYGAGFALKLFTHSTPLAVVLGTLLAGVAGAVLGALVVHRRGVYFAMITIAFGQVFYFIAFRWNNVTGGDDGLRDFTRHALDIGPWVLDIEHNAVLFYFFVLLCFAIATGCMGLILDSPFGRTLIAIRENERRARFLGIAVERHIWLSFIISCVFVGLAGALYACLNNFADPTLFNYNMSGIIVIMAVLGGFRSFWGPLVGAAFYVVLQDYLSSMTQNWMWAVGLMFMIVVLFFPRGVLGIFQRRGAA
ncbi:MAG TPA: branched-chain amino acid ABC transporter permease [Acetobacteraceae bacterium]|jgi:branched-chain amino acid transport system permease protein|nr:branched-chain amino acid ABC transporter permease [Acetobacteraceae bacterium]